MRRTRFAFPFRLDRCVAFFLDVLTRFRFIGPPSSVTPIELSDYNE